MSDGTLMDTKENKAVAIPQRHTKTCDICFLIDTQAPKDMKWHTYREAVWEDNDDVICDKCLEGIKEIRKKCNQKIDNPKHDVFKGFIPWFVKEIPGLENNFKKEG